MNRKQNRENKTGLLQPVYHALVQSYYSFTAEKLRLVLAVGDEQDRFEPLFDARHDAAPELHAYQADRRGPHEQLRRFKVELAFIQRFADERFVKMSENYETEQKTLECRVTELRSIIATQQESSVNVDIFIAKVRKYTDVRELTPENIREFVDHIEVYKPERISGHKVQRMRIVWNCIGDFMPPQPKKDEKSA